MLNGKSVLAIIPARGGSKSIPRKNLVKVGGKPLIVWTIEAAKKSKYIDRLILSSDDHEIIQTARNHGCEVPFTRPKELAADDTPGMAPVLHALNAISGKYDYIVLLQPTSPLRTSQDIDETLERCAQSRVESCVTVTESLKNPYWTYILKANNRMSPLLPTKKIITRRQDLPATYTLNGAVYVSTSAALLKKRTFITPKTIAHPMPLERSWDMDTPADLAIIKCFLEKPRASANLD